MAARCLATLVFRSDDPTDGGNFSAQVQMARLWANRMLHFQRLPIYVMHARVRVSEIFDQTVDPEGRLNFVRVPLIHAATNSTQPRYRLQWTKLHAWNLPCRRVVLLDYDGWPTQRLDSIFDACEDDNAALCACPDPTSWSVATRNAQRARGGVRPRSRGHPYFNGGVLVLRPNE